MFYCCLVTLSHIQIFCDPMDCSPPGSSVLGISQARILEWVAISFFRASSRLRDQIRISCLGRKILSHWGTRHRSKRVENSRTLKGKWGWTDIGMANDGGMTWKQSQSFNPGELRFAVKVLSGADFQRKAMYFLWASLILKWQRYQI